MNIAIFLKNLNFEVLDDSIVEAFIFKLDDGVITGLGNEMLHIRNFDFLLSWLTNKRVAVLYLEEITDDFKTKVEGVGVKIKYISELKDHPLLTPFLFTNANQ
ncbi:hypothetical protein LJB95_02485 [Paludibacteraceae bacterium OttesenSCG-928-F17]|nr:hypothetical protein [Paludibacteraceae bacterium OttesenSCG-928-F17]